MTNKLIKLRVNEALKLVLDQVDYTAGACSVTNMVGACLSTDVIEIARQALANYYKDNNDAQTQGNNNSNTGS